MQQAQQLTGGIGGRVEILRDRSGIPHIYAASTPDLYFGLGVAMAQDRLWQMDRLRRRALGRQAEILGPAYIASDIAHLTVGIDRIAEREAEALDEATHRTVVALVAGINRQIELMGRDLPPEFRKLEYMPEPFTVRDVVAIARGIWWSLNGRIDRIVAAEAARLLPEKFRLLYLTPEASENRVLQHAAGSDDATGSNNWAVHGSRTTGGKPVLCGDPHQPFWGPSCMNTHCTDRRTMPPAQGIRASPACGGAATAASPGRSPTTWHRRAICMSSRSIRPIRGVTATATRGANSTNAG
jgi:penicillin amidase